MPDCRRRLSAWQRQPACTRVARAGAACPLEMARRLDVAGTAGCRGRRSAAAVPELVIGCGGMAAAVVAALRRGGGAVVQFSIRGWTQSVSTWSW